MGDPRDLERGGQRGGGERGALARHVEGEPAGPATRGPAERAEAREPGQRRGRTAGRVVDRLRRADQPDQRAGGAAQPRVGPGRRGAERHPAGVRVEAEHPGHREAGLPGARPGRLAPGREPAGVPCRGERVHVAGLLVAAVVAAGEPDHGGGAAVTPDRLVVRVGLAKAEKGVVLALDQQRGCVHPSRDARRAGPQQQRHRRGRRLPGLGDLLVHGADAGQEPPAQHMLADRRHPAARARQRGAEPRGTLGEQQPGPLPGEHAACRAAAHRARRAAAPPHWGTARWPGCSRRSAPRPRQSCGRRRRPAAPARRHRRCRRCRPGGRPAGRAAPGAGGPARSRAGWCP